MFDWQPVFLSFKIAGIALLVVTIFGILSAYLLVRGDFPGKDVLETLITLPLVLPPVVTGFALLLLVGRQGPLGRLLNSLFHVQIVFTPFAAVLAALVVAFPLMYQSAKAAFQTIDLHLEDVARTLGAGEFKVFFTITLPLAWPGLLSGMVLSFARALGEFGATAMVAGNIPGKTQTIPVAIFFAAESNELGTAGYYVLIISLLTFAMVFGVNRWSRKKMSRNSERGCICAKGSR
jgi:molybdate transport system permease protein